MRIAFGPALPVGTAGEREYYDLLLTRYVPAEDVLGALTGATSGDLAPSACGYVGSREPSLGAALAIAVYDVVVEGGIPPEELQRSLEQIVGTGTFAVEHKGKNKVFDLAEALPKKPEVGVDRGQTTVRIVIRIGEHGSLRPEMLVAAAAPEATRLIVTRVDLMIEDEGAWRRPL